MPPSYHNSDRKETIKRFPFVFFVDVGKLRPITFDTMNNQYLVLGEKVGQAFCDGVARK